MVNSKLIDIAFQEYGVREDPSKKGHNPRIVNYFAEIGHEYITNDETAWCSAFLNWCAYKAKLVRSNMLNARSWLNVGRVITEPQFGDIVIFWRGSKDDWRGHVGIFVNKINDIIYVYGGNQNNMTCIKPYSEDKLLGYRRLYSIAPNYFKSLKRYYAPFRLQR